MKESCLEPIVGGTISPAGKPMNCNKWGDYEAPGTSETAAYCNGGTVDDAFWAPCPSRAECRSKRNEEMLSQMDSGRTTQRTHLPLMQQNQSNVRIVGSMGAAPQPPQVAPRPSYSSYSNPSRVISSAPTSIPQRPYSSISQPHAQAAPQSRPAPGNPYLESNRAQGAPRAGMHSPTFLPEQDEHWASRLVRNSVQSMLNAVGWHVHDYTQNVDLFPYKGKK